jgi:hypothetical protein
MNVILDIIGSTLFVGILIITILTINSNIVMGNYKSIATYEVQIQAAQLGRIMEYDVYKMGYKVQSDEILIAEDAHLKFKADLADNGTINTVEYLLGNAITTSVNPRDRQLTRIVDGSTLFISYNATKFKIMYYDSTMTKLPTPLSAANMKKIRSVDVVLELETPDPVEIIRNAGSNRFDTLYTGAYYEKLITARNLSF